MDEKFKIITGPIRQGALRVHVYNDGLTVFLYDAANESRIKSTDPKAIWYIDAETENDLATSSLTKSGDLLIYGMHGDGEVDLELLIGPDLTEEELRTGRWYEPQHGRINLPSGRVCVHSFNTLPMGDNEDETDGEGAILDVPAGSYAVTLHRKDWDTMEVEGVADLEEAMEAGVKIWDGERVNDVIVLTPLDSADDATEGGILFRECIIPE